jgi:hypothetical protein
MSKKRLADNQLTRNPKTHQQWADLQRREQIFGEVQAAGVLTPEALERKRAQLTREGEEVVQALLEDNKRGELTRLGAQRLADAANNSDTTTTEGDEVTTRTYEASGNHVPSLKVTGIRRKEIDTEQLAMVYWLQAKRMVRERREREVARLEKEQVKMELTTEGSKPAPQKPAPTEAPEVAKLRRQLEETRQRLHQMGVNPDDELPQPPEPESGAPQGP